MRPLDPTAEDTVYRCLARALGLVFVDLESYRVSNGVAARLPAALARERRWLPFLFNDRRVVLLCDDPFGAVATDPLELSELLGPPWNRRYGFALVSPSPLTRALESYYGV